MGPTHPAAGVLSNTELGFYQILLFKHGNWINIVVDDFLPQAGDGQPYGCRGEYHPQFCWSSLLEKAYAKLHNSYGAIGEGGHIEEALEDLTGGVGSRFYVTEV